MEISAVNIRPDIFNKQNREAPLGNVGSGNSQIKQEKEWPEIHEMRPVSEEQVIKTIEEANQSFVIHSTRLEFSIHAKTKEIMVKVLDDRTGELIREVPPEKVLDMVAMMWENIGLLVDEKA